MMVVQYPALLTNLLPSLALAKLRWGEQKVRFLRPLSLAGYHREEIIRPAQQREARWARINESRCSQSNRERRVAESMLGREQKIAPLGFSA
jgi:hypothetical protein